MQEIPPNNQNWSGRELNYISSKAIQEWKIEVEKSLNIDIYLRLFERCNL